MRKRRKNSLEEYKTNLIILFIVILLMTVNLIILIKYLSDNDSNQSQDTKINIAQASYNTVVEDITYEEGLDMPEQDRMRRYAIEFIDNLDNEEFAEAYGKLNEDFKKNFFPTQNEFEQYVKERIGTGELTINFKNIERQGNEKTGNLYILWVDVYDVLGNEYVDKLEENMTEEEKEDDSGNMNIVILEKNFDDYELSFSIR